MILFRLLFTLPVASACKDDIGFGASLTNGIVNVISLLLKSLREALS